MVRGVHFGRRVRERHSARASDGKRTMTTVGYAGVSSTGQDLAVQLEKLAGCDKVFKEKRSGVDTGRPELKRCLEYLREGDTLLVKRDTSRAALRNTF
jgi:predicted site-specific integrase-resolvase